MPATDSSQVQIETRSIMLGDFTRKLSGVEVESIEACPRVSHLLSHLPFVRVEDARPTSNISLINPKSISLSFAERGAAQCFLVISESGTTTRPKAASAELEASSSDPKLTLKRVSEFVSSSTYGKHLRILMSSTDSGVVGATDGQDSEHQRSQSPSFGRQGPAGQKL